MQSVVYHFVANFLLQNTEAIFIDFARTALQPLQATSASWHEFTSLALKGFYH